MTHSHYCLLVPLLFCSLSFFLPAAGLTLATNTQEALASAQRHGESSRVHPTNVFRTTQCRDAINRQRANFSSHWQQTVFNRYYDQVFAHDGLNVAYVFNQKAGTRNMLYAFGALDLEYGTTNIESNKHVVQYSGANLSALNIASEQLNLSWWEERKNKLLFTVVRDPLSCAWSAYTEVSHRAGQQLGLAAPCNAGDDRYLEYLNRLRDGQLRHSEIFHSFPQVLKVDVLKMLNRESFDFILRLEHIEEDLRGLFSRLEHPPKEATIREFINRFNSNTQRNHWHTSQCDSQIEQTSSERGLDARTCKVACEVYDIDFACLGYPRPSCCSQ